MNSNTLRALFIGIDPNRAAALTSAFHRLGYICRHTAVEEMGRLGAAIRDEQPDMLLFDENRSALELPHCLEAIANQQLDLPVIVLSESESLLPDHQVSDVLLPDNPERIARACLREFWSLQSRRALADTRKELAAAEARSEQILSQSEEPIAYVADGMIIGVNQLFADRFGFDNADELDCQPLIDLIAEDDVERLKTALRGVTAKETTRVSVTAHRQDGEAIQTKMVLSHSVLDGEDCVQLALRSDDDESAAQGPAVDPVTGFGTAKRFMQHLQDISAHGLAGGAQGAFLLIGVDRYTQLRREFGSYGMMAILKDFSELLLAEFPKATFGRIDGDLFGLIVSNYSEEEILDQAHQLCRKAEQRIVSIDKLSANYSLSIGVLPIGKARLANSVNLLDNLIVVVENIREEAANNGIGNGAALYVRAKQQLNQRMDPKQLFEEARTDKRLQLLYQPMVSLADEDKHYYEVKLDLKERETDEIDGDEMLKAFEAQGKSTALDRWIIVEATKQLAQQRRSGQQIRLIINLSSNVFQDKNLVSWLGVAMKAAELPADTLVLQFQANSAAKMLKPALVFTEQLRKLGGNIALRTGSATNGDATALKQLSPLLAKLDISPKEGGVLSEAITTAQEAGSKVIVQGVESAATLATLWQLKPDYVQGSYIHEAGTEMDYEFGEA